MFGGEAELDAAEQWVDSWQADIEARAARAKALAAQLQGVRGQASAGGGLVDVTVNSSGALVELRLDDEVRRHSGAWIAEQVLAAVRAATADLARKADAVTEEIFGRESVEGRVVLRSFTARLGQEP